MKRSFPIVLILVLLTLLASACGQENTPAASTNSASTTENESASSTNDAAANEATASEASGSTHAYTDYKGRQVEVPNDPQKIVYVGSNPGDLLAIGVKPIGATLSVIGKQIAYPELIEGIEDVGYPFAAEKILALKPDLILFDDWDEAGIEQLSKIAPTVVVGMDGTFPTEERVTKIAELLDRTDQAAKWFDDYHAKAEATKAKLSLNGDETAVTLLLLGSDMYIMGNKGFNRTLLGDLGLKPSDGLQKLIDKDERFVNVSDEVLPDYMGSLIFVLGDSSDETTARQTTLTDSSLWKSIPAVKANHVYWLDSKYNFDDPITLDRLLDEIVKVMGR